MGCSSKIKFLVDPYAHLPGKLKGFIRLEKLCIPNVKVRKQLYSLSVHCAWQCFLSFRINKFFVVRVQRWKFCVLSFLHFLFSFLLQEGFSNSGV